MAAEPRPRTFASALRRRCYFVALTPDRFNFSAAGNAPEGTASLTL